LSAAKSAKQILEQEMKKQEYQDLHIAYVSDMADMISKDFDNLFRT